MAITFTKVPCDFRFRYILLSSEFRGTALLLRVGSLPQYYWWIDCRRILLVAQWKFRRQKLINDLALQLVS
jgi:hypothetical protein